MTEADIEAIDRHVEAVMDEAVEFAEESPQPDVDEFLAEVARAQPSIGDGTTRGQDEVSRRTSARARRGDDA